MIEMTGYEQWHSLVKYYESVSSQLRRRMVVGFVLMSMTVLMICFDHPVIEEGGDRGLRGTYKEKSQRRCRG